MLSVFLALDDDVGMASEHSPSTSDADTHESDVPTEPQFRHFVELRHQVAGAVSAYYDTTVTVAPETDEETIVARAAEIVADRVPTATVDELELACIWLDAVILDATRREALPATLATIECAEHVRYRHDGGVCEGRIADVRAGQAAATLDVVIRATRIKGIEPGGHTFHRVPLTAIDAHLAETDG